MHSTIAQAPAPQTDESRVALPAAFDQPRMANAAAP
jgi:hypothetical protein